MFSHITGLTQSHKLVDLISEKNSSKDCTHLRCSTLKWYTPSISVPEEFLGKEFCFWGTQSPFDLGVNLAKQVNFDGKTYK